MMAELTVVNRYALRDAGGFETAVVTCTGPEA
jgi:hypothetical protein